MGTKANRSKLKHLALSSKGHRKLITETSQKKLSSNKSVKSTNIEITPTLQERAHFHCICLRI